MDEEKRTELQKLGYFPVTDEFWVENDMQCIVGQGYNWAMQTPRFVQAYMPYHESYLDELSLERAAHYAQRNLIMK